MTNQEIINLMKKNEELLLKKAEIDKEIKENNAKLQEEAQILCGTQDTVRNECFTLTKKVTQDKSYNFVGFVKQSNANALFLIKYITEKDGKIDITAKKTFEKFAIQQNVDLSNFTTVTENVKYKFDVVPEAVRTSSTEEIDF